MPESIIKTNHKVIKNKKARKPNSTGFLPTQLKQTTKLLSNFLEINYVKRKALVFN